MRVRQEEVKPDKSADQCAMRAYAQRHISELARAAAEGYDVAGAVLDHLMRQVSLASPSRVPVDSSWCDPTGTPVAGACMFHLEDPAWAHAELEERKSPGPAAFALLDRVRSHCGQIDMPEPVKVEIGRISRFQAGRGRPWHTVVVVILRPRHWDPRVIVFRVPEKE